ncbi:hypothetical protein TRFO_35542 [Tritrichomonas foetus]|uniref:Uncharacterized protein n=1 Tax=Tritrichomonas foetus TaxID=1144522 RepID=A0A1J4JLH0_9EUKA|nr:hypothetical protein TRFO_35542 [Tritrichomonas foetus]|eukprot:OHS98116.1 hypothetical protein TRFO_35542 [Tritrichomonas foetus]
MEEELENLIHDLRYGNGSSYSPLYEFFSKALQKNQTIKITPKIKENIPFLSTCDSGMIWPVAQKVMPEFDPSMLVPKLDYRQNPFVPVTPPRLEVSPHPGTIPTKLMLPIHPLQVKTVRPVPVKTTREMLPALANYTPGQFYYCSPRKTSRPEDSLSYKIHRKRHPLIPLTPDQKILTLNGMMNITPKSKGEFTPMKQFLHSHSKLFLSRNIPIFNNWMKNKLFIRWVNRLRNKRFKRIQSTVLNSCPLGHTEFFEEIFEIRQTATDLFKECHPIKSGPIPSDLFGELVQNSNDSLKEMREQMKELVTSLAKNIEHFIFQVSGISHILRADYAVLKKIEALPEPVIPYSLDDERDQPSITGSQIRTKILQKERRRALDRKEYLPQFFIYVRLFLRDFFVEQLHSSLLEFYERFTEVPPTKSHQVQLLLDKDKGLVLSPSREEFLNWFNVVDKAIKDIFICDQLSLDQEKMDQLFPNRDCPGISVIETVAVNHEMNEMRQNAIQTINDAFDFFEKKLKPSAIVLTKLQGRLEEISGIKEFNDTESYINTTKETLGLVGDVAQLARISTFGSLYSDMKEGKSAIYDQLHKVADGLRVIGVAKARDLYEDINFNKNEYLKIVSVNKMMGYDTETSEILNMKKLIKVLCNSFIPLGQCVIESWPSDVSIAELEGFMVSVKETLIMVAPPKPPRTKRVKRVVKKTSNTE